MKLSLFSWNVKGMMIPGRKQVVQGVLQKVKPKIVFLQEVKSSRFELRGRMSYVWNGPFWATDHD
jgi:exonuclease III